ncbi:hypothetical protein RD1_0608 [Roseobacter denitrificans OCh 114]|uniref:Uncharacterized protein n=1 Tax=Roseobacter denitrificans (strain ATCC 33942 / OCh 114) TaxID=375451 RepID=Q16CI5_ROSDO|nr:hypothetical protein RD1_0608 [Roseobacter denitrificans OCh 114]
MSLKADHILGIIDQQKNDVDALFVRWKTLRVSVSPLRQGHARLEGRGVVHACIRACSGS